MKHLNLRALRLTFPVMFILLLCSIHCAGQTTNISGVVNIYKKVIEIVPAKACLRLSDVTGINVNTRVMIVQMKGAAVSTNTNSTFGDTTATNGAGLYEIGTICYIRGDSVFLFHNLMNTYDVNSKVQLVQFAEYYSANVIDTVKAAAWDNTAGTGGVIAIFANQDITLNAPIFADSLGYKGGAYLLSNNTCSNFFPANLYSYTASTSTPQSGAYKGEGIYEFAAANQTGGRGAPANGGGGGNNHNNSGGGGANLSAGGRGGGNSSSTGSCTATFRGEAGKPLLNWGGRKIFMGGGGGAGHANNGIITKGGGNGGGIIFIWANTINGNNNFITASGGNGGDSQSDGAGGGGAGGTIIMQVTNYSGALTIQANGGSGGNSNDGGNIGLCFGGGGGGSGGAIYYTAAVPAVTSFVTGGAAGAESGRDATCAAAQAALAGSNGVITASYTFQRSFSNASYCASLLPSSIQSFTGKSSGQVVRLDWQIKNPELVKQYIIERKDVNQQWMAIGIKSGTLDEVYQFTDADPMAGNNFYRLKIIDQQNSYYYSGVVLVTFLETGNDLSVYPNPATHTITISRKLTAITQLQLTDMNGKLLWKTVLVGTTQQVNLPSLPAGVYLLRADALVKKLVIRE